MHFFRSAFGTALKIIFIFFLAIPPPGGADELSSRQTHFLNFNKSQNTISADIIGTDISDVAKTLSKEAGIKVLLDDHVTRTITSKFQNMPVEAGIKKLLGPNLSSAFIFSKEKDPLGEAVFRLDTVKIFKSGNMAATSFRTYNKGILSGKDKGAEVSSFVEYSDSGVNSNQQHIGLKKRVPRTRGAIKYEIMLARQNLDLIRQKNRLEVSRGKRKIAELKMKLNRIFSLAERSELVRKLGQAEQNLTRIKNLNSRIIIDEEMNIRELNQSLSKIDEQKKLADRHRKAEKRRDSERQRITND